MRVLVVYARKISRGKTVYVKETLIKLSRGISVLKYSGSYKGASSLV